MADSSRFSLYRILQSQGFGTRRYYKDLVLTGLVFVNGVEMESPDALVDTAGLVLDVDGERWAYHARAHLMLNRPTGVKCSQKPEHHPSVYTLLPVPLREYAVQCVGRLDQDITGLLLLTDDSQLVHIITSPCHQVPKVYEVTIAESMTEVQIAQPYVSVLLADGNENVAVTWVECAGMHHLHMALTQGKYHQVKRMAVVAGNHVVGLHRSAISGPPLGDPAPGEWCWLEIADLEALNTMPSHATKPST